MTAFYELEYEPHFERYNQLFGGQDAESVAHAHREAQHDHSLVVFDALRDAATATVDLSHYLTQAQARYYLLYGASGLTPSEWSTPHVGFGREGGPLDGAQEEAQP